MSMYDGQDDIIYEPEAQSSLRGLMFALIALVCLVIGLGLGLFYTWRISPIIETNTRPDQLRAEDRLNYIVAVALDYAYQEDLDRTYTLLAEIDPSTDPFQLAANTVCDMKNKGRVQTSADIEVARYLISIFRFQPGVTPSCDLTVFATSLPPTLVTLAPTIPPTPSPVPVASKTPTPDLQSNATITPDIVSPPPTAITGDFVIVSERPFCDPENSGIIEIFVREANTAAGVPGIEVSVQWSTPRGQVSQSFYSGLKPNRGDGYADFEMEAGNTYQVSLPGRGGPTQRLVADTCDDEGTLRSYQVIFQS